MGRILPSFFLEKAMKSTALSGAPVHSTRAESMRSTKIRICPMSACGWSMEI